MIPRRFSRGSDVPGPRWFKSLGKVVMANAVKCLAPLYGSVTPGGLRLEFRPQPRFNGLVTAFAGGAYTVAEAAFNPATKLWSILAGGRTVLNAYEYNRSATVTIGSAVEVRATSAGDWRFYVVRYGTAGSGCSTIPTVSVTLAPVCCTCPASTVTLRRSGTVVGSCSIPGPTFGLNGVCTISVDLPPGTVVDYEVVASPYPTKTGSFVVPDCGSNVDVVVPLLLTDIYPTLTLTDPIGNAIVLTPVAGTTYYEGSQSYTYYGGTTSISYRFNDPCGISSFGCSLSGFPTSVGASVGGGTCFDPSLGTVAQPYCVTYTSRSRTCPPMLTTWVIRVDTRPFFCVYGQLGIFGVFFATYPTVPSNLTYTLTP